MIPRLLSSPSFRDWIFAVFASAIAVVGSHLIFSDFFPGPNGVGHDYSGGLTSSLAEYYWSLSEGPWLPPWFTPAFCGGIPLYADPVNAFFSLPAVLMRFFDVDPLRSNYITFLVSVGIGAISAFFLVRYRLAGSVTAAVLAAIFFSLNGFLSSRTLVGHTMYHGFALVPLVAFLVTNSPGQPNPPTERYAVSIIAGLVAAYWVYSGGGVLIIPFALASLLLVCVSWLSGSNVRETFQRLFIALFVAIIVSASKVTAALSYMSAFPRTGYRLPGFSNLFETVQIALLTLFFNKPDIAKISAEGLVNLQWLQDRHEFEYGVTIVPAILLGLGLIFSLQEKSCSSNPLITSLKSKSPKNVTIAIMVLALLTVPILINTYDESWNEFLKELPFVGSSSSLIRWFVILTAFAAVLGGLAIDCIATRTRQKIIIGALSITGVFFSLSSVDREFYITQSYNPKPVLAAFEAARVDPNSRPPIRHIGAYIDQSGAVLLTANRQDLLITGVSQLACYFPIFGYRLEFFPFKTLRPGSIYETTVDGFNMKNPACFVFPKENFCEAGDHFPVSRRADLEAFAKYEKFPFNKSLPQSLADAASLLGLLLSTSFLAWALLSKVRRCAAEIKSAK